MHQARPIWIAIVILFILPEFVYSRTVASSDDMSEIMDQLTQAMDQRNFQEARVAIDILLPLMKENLKKSKKTLNELKKADQPEIEVESYEKRLLRKTDLYNGLKEMLDKSPAALRVKSESIKEDIDEFVNLD